ncbi:MAG: dephospho-CoA kinase [Clostridia bacterium]|nr:dephospho-CoA kinase [Clostridia bacterium]MDE7328780.1 dephospho-CoA kinase [Clostridia bacterium]
MIIAVIGGIGSGKSSVLRMLENLGFRVCDCDKIYNQVCEREDYIGKVGEVFNVVKDGKIDKARLGDIVFADKARLRLLNSLAHPYVFDKINEIYLQDNSPLFVEVSAFDRSMKDKFDLIVLVKSSSDKRVQRVKLRSGYSEDRVLSIISQQISEEEGEALADFVIVNDGDLEALREQVERLKI